MTETYRTTGRGLRGNASLTASLSMWMAAFRSGPSSPRPGEDKQYRLGQDPYKLWSALTMPVLLVRTAQQVPPNFGFLITKEDYARFLREVPTATGVEIEANHYAAGMALALLGL